MTDEVKSEYKLRLGGLISWAPMDYVYLEAYHYCLTHNLVPVYCSEESHQLVAAITGVTPSVFTDVGSVLFNVHNYSDSAKEDALSVRRHQSGTSKEMSVLLAAYWLHRYTSDDKNKPFFYREEDYDGTAFNININGVEQYTHVTGIPKTGCELFDYIWGSDDQPYELRYTFGKRPFVHFYDYDENLLFAKPLMVAKDVHCLGIYTPAAFQNEFDEQATVWCNNTERYLLDDEYVRYNILNRRYFTQRYVMHEGKVVMI